MRLFSQLTVLFVAVLPSSSLGQIFNPVGPALPDAQQAQPYSTYVLATIPDSTTVSGTDVSAMLIQQFPPLALFINDIQGLTYPMDIESVEFFVSGLPAGISRTCTPSTCRFSSTNVGSVVFSGTPTEAVDSVVMLASYTRGTLDISQLTTSLGLPGLPNSFELPSGLHTLFDQQYDLHVEGPNGIDTHGRATGIRIAAGNELGTVHVMMGEEFQGPTDLMVTDISGRTVVNSNYPAGAGDKVMLDMRHVPSGLYVLRVQGKDTARSVKFIH
jgi:hypothetical protein